MVSVYSVMLRNTTVTHQQILIVTIPTSPPHVLMYIDNHGMGIHSQPDLEKGRLATNKQERTTHIEDSKDLVEFRLPSRNHFPVVPRVKR